LLTRAAREINMKQSMGYVFLCSLSLFACHVEHWDDCDDDDFGDDFGRSHHAGGVGNGGSSAQAGSDAGGGLSAGGTTGAGAGSSGGAAAGTGGQSGERAGSGAGGDADPGPRPISCKDERDCPKGYNCNLDARECEAATEETCAELATEAACTHRTDCTPIYAGTDCSCGQDCSCHGGEPGCVCASFEFFVCRTSEMNSP